MDICIGVGGRFHSDQTLKTLISQGHRAHLFTSLPESRFEEWLRPYIRTLVVSEIVYRSLKKMGKEDWGDILKVVLFAKWFARHVCRLRPELIIGWSSYSLEAFKQGKDTRKILVRGSAHIEYQYEVLAEEYRKLRAPLPTREFFRERELQEYELADKIIVLSNFSRNTFLSRGVPENKIFKIELGVDTSKFNPPQSLEISRPLQIVYFGYVSVRKGISYLLDALERLPKDRFHLTLVGDIEPALRERISKSTVSMDYFPALPKVELNLLLKKKHIFVFPSLEDGYGQALVQAMACGLICIASQSVGASELIRNGLNGYVVPPRNSSSITSVLEVLGAMSSEDLMSLRKAAIRTAEENSWGRYSSKLLQLIGELAPELPTRAA